MAHCVFVWPLNLLGAYYHDLHGDGPVTKKYEMVHAQEKQYGADGWRSSMVFDFDTPLVADGHIDISVAGRFVSGFLESERTCMMAMVDRVRGEHGLCPADYSLIAISEKRALFNSMRDIIQPCRNDQLRMCSAMDDCRAALVDVCQKASDWVGANHEFSEHVDIVAVAEFHAMGSELGRNIQQVVSNSKRLSDAIAMRNMPPIEQRQLDVTSSMPMVIDWEHSFVTLRTVYTAAIKKLGGVLTNLTVLTMRDGQMKATIDSSVHPHFFAGELAATKRAALAKLYYAVIKHVNIELGYTIVDWHYEVLEYQKSYIAHFDENMGGLEKCCKDIHQLMFDTLSAFDEAVADLSGKLDINDRTEGILAAVHDCSVSVKCAKYKLVDNWNSLKGRQIERSTIEAQLADGP